MDEQNLQPKKIKMPLWITLIILSGITIGAIAYFLPGVIKDFRKKEDERIAQITVQVIQRTLTETIDGKSQPIWVKNDLYLKSEIDKLTATSTK